MRIILYFPVFFHSFFIRRRATEAAASEFRAETAVDAFGNAAFGKFRLDLGDFGHDRLPSLACLRACLRTQPPAGNEHHSLRIGEAFVHDRRILAARIAIDPGPVRPLSRDEMFYSEFMPHEMNAHPIRQIEPFPVEAELPHRRMLGEENRLFPL